MRTRRVASADGSLTMITYGRGLERTEDLRLTDAGRRLIVSRHVSIGARWVVSKCSSDPHRRAANLVIEYRSVKLVVFDELPKCHSRYSRTTTTHERYAELGNAGESSCGKIRIFWILSQSGVRPGARSPLLVHPAILQGKGSPRGRPSVNADSSFLARSDGTAPGTRTKVTQERHSRWQFKSRIARTNLIV